MLLPKKYTLFLEDKLFEIEKSFSTYLKASKEIGLLEGKTGVALFYYELFKYTGKDVFRQQCIGLVYEAVTDLGKDTISLYYYNGLAGIVWIIEFLINKKVLDSHDSILDQTKRLLIRCTHNAIDNYNYEFLSGALGYMMPFIQTKDSKVLTEFYNRLASKGEECMGEVSWKSADYDSGKEIYCFGLAHGMAGIVKFSSDLIANKVLERDFTNVVDKLYRYYVTSINRKLSLGSLLPNWIVSNKDQMGKSRLAWCHGDISAGISFLQSGKKLLIQRYTDLGNKLLLNSLDRKNLTTENIIDSCICHGTLGLSYIYYKAHQVESNFGYEQSARFWLDATLQISQDYRGKAGFKFHFGERGWNDGYGILNGIAGNGLVILSLLDKNCSEWDECIGLDN